MYPTLTLEQADRIYHVLVRVCGASAAIFDKHDCVRYLATPEEINPGVPFKEYRFMGALGSGGKINYKSGDLYVSNYPESSTPERDLMVLQANARLHGILHGDRLMTEVSDTLYVSNDGWSLAREEGKTPNGNDFNNCWVLRNSRREYVDHDSYRHDMEGRYNLKLGA